MENKIPFEELEVNKDWKEAVIVFSDESFGNRGFTVEERSYKVSGDAKFFDPNMIGSSLFGNCLDGKDIGVRLDWYMNLKPDEGRRWEVEYCYIVK
ncbi:hypothetical protein [Paenibacillus sp. Mc5Re-14]|uniref:hypothetical protein n=1 Tax=Paenibacillus sp. Mc5Re-14 TaxID=1030529 RepID=UPI000AF14456|nr:hypothetical protein [Paenibacillus sp. Mc5Re-14]